MVDENGNGHASLRDVYDLVDRVRQELTAAVTALTDRLNVVVGSHEHRLTTLEAGHRSHSEALAAAQARLESHGRAIGELKDSERAEDAATKALTAAKDRKTDGWRWGVGTLVAVGTVLAIVLPLVLH